MSPADPVLALHLHDAPARPARIEAALAPLLTPLDAAHPGDTIALTLRWIRARPDLVLEAGARLLRMQPAGAAEYAWRSLPAGSDLRTCVALAAMEIFEDPGDWLLPGLAVAVPDRSPSRSTPIVESHIFRHAIVHLPADIDSMMDDSALEPDGALVLHGAASGHGRLAGRAAAEDVADLFRRIYGGQVRLETPLHP